MIVKRIILKRFFCGIPLTEKTNEFLEAIVQKFQESDKAQTYNLLTSLNNAKFDNFGNARNYILKLVEITIDLKKSTCQLSIIFLFFECLTFYYQNMNNSKFHILLFETMVLKIWRGCDIVRFQRNIVDQCIYLKVTTSKFIVLVLVDDILLTSIYISLLHETKRFLLSQTFEMKDMDEASFVLGFGCTETGLLDYYVDLKCV